MIDISFFGSNMETNRESSASLMLMAVALPGLCLRASSPLFSALSFEVRPSIISCLGP